MRKIRNRLPLLCVLSGLAFLMFPACTGKSDERSILEVMKNVGSLAEDKDAAGLMNLLVEDYTDFEGQNKSLTRKMVNDYFKSYRGIVIHILGTRIDKIESGTAGIQTDVALSSGGAQFFRKLIRFSTDNYRFKIKLVKSAGLWRIQFAEWNPIRLDELFPESLSILKKLFPNF